MNDATLVLISGLHTFDIVDVYDEVPVRSNKLIHGEYPALKIIILSVYGEDRFVTHLMDLGVNAYLFRNVEPQEVERVIRAVVKTDFILTKPF